MLAENLPPTFNNRHKERVVIYRVVECHEHYYYYYYYYLYYLYYIEDFYDVCSLHVCATYSLHFVCAVCSKIFSYFSRVCAVYIRPIFVNVE